MSNFLKRFVLHKIMVSRQNGFQDMTKTAIIKYSLKYVVTKTKYNIQTVKRKTCNFV